MFKKSHVRDPYLYIPPIPFVASDYVLCVIAFFLTGIASNAQIASLIASVRR
jgi:hypothetical protein